MPNLLTMLNLRNIPNLRFSLLCIIIWPFILSAQSNSSLELAAGGGYSFRHLALTDAAMDTLGDFVNFRNRESGIVNWQFGIHYNRRIGRQFFFKIGLRYLSMRHAGPKVTDLRWPGQHNGMGGFDPDPDPNLPRGFQTFTDYLFFEIPLSLRWEFSQKRWRPYVEAGLSPAWFATIQRKVVTDLSTEVFRHSLGDISYKAYNRLHWVSSLVFGMNYVLSDRWQLFAQVGGRYHLTRLVDAPISEYLYAAGLEIGGRWGF